jgi:hypothetical protein
MEVSMLLGADYPFLDVLWTMILFFAFFIWIWLLIRVFADIFRRRDIGGGKKTMWVLFVIFFVFLGVLIYLIVNGQEMGERDIGEARARQAEFDQYVQSVAASGGAAAEIEKAQKLLESGAITQAEFDAIKAKALQSA